MIKDIQISFFSENTVSMDHSNMWGEHGFGALISIGTGNSISKLVFDVGASNQVVSHNLDLMKLDLNEVNAIIISHGHYDHTGGMLEILKRVGRRTPIIIHPQAFSVRFAEKGFREIGIPFSRQKIEDAGGVITPIKDGMQLADGIYITGEIERNNHFEKVHGFLIEENNKLIEDVVLDEKALIIDSKEGLIIILGCGHAGIVNTLTYISKLFKNRKISSIVGGFHLEKADNNRISDTVDSLKKFRFDSIVPLHCTGPRAVCAFINAWGEKVKALRVGDTLKI